jgi:hypothetical protein
MMRILLLAVVCLVAGAVWGSWLASLEFFRETHPLQHGPNSAALLRSGGKMGPRLVVLSAERHNFGVMDQNSKARHTFEIKNEGDEPLVLTQEGTSCKCTAAGLSKDQLAPGEKASITLEWTANDATPPYEQYAEYGTNDVLRPKLRLLVFGDVRAAIHVEPREAVFNRVSAQAPARAIVRLYAYSEKQLEIVSYKFAHAKSAPFFSIEHAPIDPATFPPGAAYKSGIELQIIMKPGLPLGQLKQDIQITTTQNPEVTLDIPVYGSVVSDISLVGPGTSAETMIVDLGSITSQQGAKSTVFLVVKGSLRDQVELTIASVNPHTELKASLGEPLKNNSQIVSYPLMLEVARGAKPVSRTSGGGRVRVLVETTHPQIKQVTLYVQYAVVD